MPNKTISTVLLSGFHSSPGDMKSTEYKAVPGTFYGSGGRNKRKSLQDRANFHKSRAW